MIGKATSLYRTIEKLGEGGMGVVYRAEATSLRRTVALKFLPPEMTQDPEAKRASAERSRDVSWLRTRHRTT